VGVAALHALVEPAFSAPVAMRLDRPGEKALVDRMFANPRFVEDVTREAVQALVTAKAGRAARVRAVAFESIHPYDCAATWEGEL
jgi:GTP cyclohydrolase FolE2